MFKWQMNFSESLIIGSGKNWIVIDTKMKGSIKMFFIYLGSGFQERIVFYYLSIFGSGFKEI